MKSTSRPLTTRLRFLALAATTVVVSSFALAQLIVSSNDALGDHLTTADGMAVYVFLPDAQGPSTCEGGCAAAWPPVEAVADAVVGEGIDADAVGATERSDGSSQVTYFGWPLYTFAQDTEPGMIAGQEVGGNWFVIAPDGTIVGADLGEGGDGATEEQVAMSQEEYDALFRDGIRTYRSVCAACHGREGNEVLSTHVLKLNDNTNLADPVHVIRQVIHGNGYMPGFGGAFSDRQVAAVVTYVRNSWGNEYGPVREEDIAQHR